MIPQMTKCLGIKIEKLVDPIMVHLAQGIVRPLFIVVKGVELFSWGVHFVENFTLCDLDHFDSILGNIFLDAYGIDIFCNKKNMCQGRL
jgi:hypothetical protein